MFDDLELGNHQGLALMDYLISSYQGFTFDYT